MKYFCILFCIVFTYSGCNHKPESKSSNDESLLTKTSKTNFQTKLLKDKPDYIAPDGSMIFLLPERDGGGMCICELPVGQTTQAVKHKTVEEIWFILSGEGEVWRLIEGEEEVTKVFKDISLTIPLGCHFQFKNNGDVPLRILIATFPHWPGEDEAVKVDNYWELN